MSDIFSLSENSSYNLRCGITVNRRSNRTSTFGFETGITIRVILWNDLPAELKNGDILKNFKQKIKLWSPNECLCKICRKRMKNLGHRCFQKPKKKILLLNFKSFKKKKPAVSLAKFIMYKIV